MKLRRLLTLSVALGLIGCVRDGTDGPTGPGFQNIDIRASDAEGAVLASASGGANWALIIEGIPPIDQVLGFSATKFDDGTVRGHIEYQQTFFGETFRFNATVTCMNVYDGNRVKYGGEVIVSNDPTVPPGTFIWFQGIDNGEGAGAPPDQSTGSGFGTEEENQEFCDSPAPPNPIFVADIDGNIQVDG